ncbi:14904_t:CDS:2 [Entrophospora sp. SA101]|nr:14904_t:CDS:2 [Entrophospora sp. SA101]
MSKMIAGQSINKPDSVNENSSLKDSLHGYIGDYSTETTRLIEEEEKYRDSKPETKICCFSSQNYNVVSDIKKELKNVMTKPPLYRYVFMFVPLNIIHGVAFVQNLHHIHYEDFIHRDFHPGNILIGANTNN